MEHDYMRCCCVIHASAHMDTNRRLANVQYLLWQSYLVPDAIRSFDAYLLVCFGLFPAALGRSYQYPVDEDT
jgi:hypothetical protein